MLRPVLPVALFVALSAQLASAQIRPTYVQFDEFTVKGALYRPDPGSERNVGVLLIHRVNNYLGHIAAWELANRGYRRAGDELAVRQQRGVGQLGSHCAGRQERDGVPAQAAAVSAR